MKLRKKQKKKYAETSNSESSDEKEVLSSKRKKSSRNFGENKVKSDAENCEKKTPTRSRLRSNQLSSNSDSETESENDDELKQSDEPSTSAVRRSARISSKKKQKLVLPSPEERWADIKDYKAKRPRLPPRKLADSFTKISHPYNQDIDSQTSEEAEESDKDFINDDESDNNDDESDSPGIEVSDSESDDKNTACAKESNEICAESASQDSQGREDHHQVSAADNGNIVITVQQQQRQAKRHRLSSDDDNGDDDITDDDKKEPQTIVVSQWDANRPINIVLQKRSTPRKTISSDEDEEMPQHTKDTVSDGRQKSGNGCSPITSSSAVDAAGTSKQTDDTEWGELEIDDKTLVSYACSLERKEAHQSRRNNQNGETVSGNDDDDDETECEENSSVMSSESESEVSGDDIAERSAKRVRKKLEQKDREIVDKFTRLKEARARKQSTGLM